MSKIRTFSKNCSVKVELLFISHLLSISYDSNTLEFKKKILHRGSYAKYWKGFCIVLTNYTYRFQKYPLGAFNFEKIALDQFFLWKLHTLKNVFTLHLHVCFCVSKTKKTAKPFQNITLFNLIRAVEKVLKL